MKRYFLFLTAWLLVLLPSMATAQNAILKGRTIDSTSQKPLAGVELKPGKNTVDRPRCEREQEEPHE